MTGWLVDINTWLLLGLFLTGTMAFVISTLAGGGGALILVPLLNATVGVNQTAVVLNVGTFIGRPTRLILFWSDINWRVVVYYAPTAIIGAWLGAYLFSSLKLTWLQLFIGVFLVSTLWQFRWGKKQRSFKVPLLAFLPLGFLVSILGTLIGALGPILNPFYLNAGLIKETMIATKTANAFIMGVAQLSGYAYFGMLTKETLIYGLALGAGAMIGNVIGKKTLQNISSTAFIRWVLALMVISGIILIYKGANALWL